MSEIERLRTELEETKYWAMGHADPPALLRTVMVLEAELEETKGALTLARALNEDSVSRAWKERAEKAEASRERVLVLFEEAGQNVDRLEALNRTLVHEKLGLLKRAEKAEARVARLAVEGDRHDGSCLQVKSEALARIQTLEKRLAECEDK
jgi:hypothetical protein